MRRGIDLAIGAHMGKVIACTRARAGMTLMGRPPGGARRAGLQRLPVGCRPLRPVPRRRRRRGPRGPPEPFAGAVE